MNYKCPYRERVIFCTNKNIQTQVTSNGKKYCSYKDPFKCPFFLDYYNSLSEQEKCVVLGLKSPQRLSMDKGWLSNDKNI